MEEINKKTLIEALSSLPEHEAPEAVWEAIETEMSGETLFTRQQLHHLPEYEPPGFVWEKIASQLGGSAKTVGRIVPIGLRRALAVAASLALVLAAYWQFGKAEKAAENYTVQYSTETVDDLLLEQDWNEDEDAFEEFKAICEAKKYVCEHPEFQSLKSDLDELTEAKVAIQTAIGEYGADPDLITQIKEIELERTDILKKMLVMLI